MDNEAKKAIQGDAWADKGDRVDVTDSTLGPALNRATGFPASYSSTDTPHREKLNQIFRELYGGAKELRSGVPEYDAEVAYKLGDITKVGHTLYYCSVAQNTSTPTNPSTPNQTDWILLGNRPASSRGAPPAIRVDDIDVTSEVANKLEVWWTIPSNGGFNITSTDLEWSTDSSFATSTSLTDYTMGTEITLPSGTYNHNVFVRLKQYNSAGESPWSNPGKRARTDPVIASHSALTRGRTGVAAGQIEFDWVPPKLNGVPRAIKPHRAVEERGAGIPVVVGFVQHTTEDRKRVCLDDADPQPHGRHRVFVPHHFPQIDRVPSCGGR